MSHVEKQLIRNVSHGRFEWVEVSLGQKATFDRVPLPITSKLLSKLPQDKTFHLQ